MLMQGCLKTWHLGSNAELLPSSLPQNGALITLGSLAATSSFRRLLKPPSSSLDSSLVAQKSLITSWSEGLSNPFSHREDEDGLWIWEAKPSQKDHGDAHLHIAPRAGALSTAAVIVIRKGPDKRYRSITLPLMGETGMPKVITVCAVL